ncbi:Protein phosphatase 2A regulary subunit B [Giardia muris]|uniref:Protein phosphatase 2A regulary subunit B n=1 Tax=Giardia muris TaxID=5742 RepID=A0A4Z1T0G0_GIAMU|nr:Protein phosphatase 2A regulary subunit B [Giardia muris]|eukprot:TNJ27393.1 Protein phosphatase 2A regulary subunit B [Giardia muris]
MLVTQSRRAKDLLRERGRRDTPSAVELEQATERELRHFIPPAGPANVKIPAFSNPGLLRSRSDLQDVFYRISRTITLRKVYEPLQTCTTEDLLQIVDLHSDANGYVNYDAYRAIVRDICKRHPIYAEFLTVKLFLALPRTKETSMRPDQALLFHADVVKMALARVISSAQTRITLTTCDVDGKGYLIEADIENYILELAHLYPHLRDCDEVFRPFYLCTVIKPLFFFLDPVHKRRVAISDLLISPYMDQIFANPSDPPQEALGTLQGPLAQRYTTWFSPDTVIDLYTSYISADADQDGLLSESEIRELANHKFTSRFTRALLLTVQTFNGKLDYRGFIDLMLCIAFPRSRAAAAYIFRVLDTEFKGYLTRQDVLYFLEEMLAGLQAYCGEGVVFNIDDLCDEVFDGVAPRTPSEIRMGDVIASRSGDVLITFLIDPLLFIDKELQLQQGHVMMRPLPFEVSSLPSGAAKDSASSDISKILCFMMARFGNTLVSYTRGGSSTASPTTSRRSAPPGTGPSFP